MSQYSPAESAFLAEIGRVLHGTSDSATHFYSLRHPMPPNLQAAMTAWLRTLPSGLGEAELSARARAWYDGLGSPEGESDSPAT